MAMNNIIVYFPLGAGGNFIRNIITLDTSVDFFDDSEFFVEYPDIKDRYSFLYRYYSTPVDSESWLKREWSIRTNLHVRYYENNNISFWNPNSRIVFLVHGQYDELYSILIDRKLRHYDRSAISQGLVQEQLSKNGLISSTHIFLIPREIDLFTKIYCSKNHVFNHLVEPNGVEQRQHEVKTLNRGMQQRLIEIQDYIKHRSNKILSYDAEDLFSNNGSEMVIELTKRLSLNIDPDMIKSLHSIWLSSTRQLYFACHGTELTL